MTAPRHRIVILSRCTRGFGLDHDGQRIPSKYDAYLGTELIVRASATPLLAAARALVALTV